MNSILRFIVIALVLLSFSAVTAQYAGPESSYGLEIGGAYGDNNGDDESWSPRIKLNYQFRIANPISTQIGLSYTTLLGGSGYKKTKTVAGDVRFLLRTMKLNQVYPFIYAGAGVAKNMQTDDSGFMPIIPLGIGIQTPLGEELMFQISGGYNLVLSDELDGVERSDSDLNRFTNGKQDGFFEIVIGLSYGNPKKSTSDKKVDMPKKVVNPDKDGDGINDDLEMNKYNTDPNLADTDSDGLKDGEEIKKYKTDPLKADTDEDGLNDGEEVLKYKTDPLKSDTDGDDLSDGEEVRRYKTDPLKSDTDGDGLTDGEEVLKYKTDPLKTDTDGDGLNDYEEIITHRTNALKIDTDDGGMNDGAEIEANKNPLDPKDDLLDLSKGKKIVLHGITFASDKAKINPVSATILEKVRESMEANPDANVTIIGHTDNVGNDEYNLSLSRERAQAVKDWLVKNNISASRMKVVGKGENEPIATNDTKEGRAKNRRIEFLVE